MGLAGRQATELCSQCTCFVHMAGIPTPCYAGGDTPRRNREEATPCYARGLQACDTLSEEKRREGRRAGVRAREGLPGTEKVHIASPCVRTPAFGSISPPLARSSL